MNQSAWQTNPKTTDKKAKFRKHGQWSDEGQKNPRKTGTDHTRRNTRSNTMSERMTKLSGTNWQ